MRLPPLRYPGNLAPARNLTFLFGGGICSWRESDGPPPWCVRRLLRCTVPCMHAEPRRRAPLDDARRAHAPLTLPRPARPLHFFRVCQQGQGLFVQREGTRVGSAQGPSGILGGVARARLPPPVGNCQVLPRARRHEAPEAAGIKLGRIACSLRQGQPVGPAARWMGGALLRRCRPTDLLGPIRHRMQVLAGDAAPRQVRLRAAWVPVGLPTPKHCTGRPSCSCPSCG